MAVFAPHRGKVGPVPSLAGNLPQSLAASAKTRVASFGATTSEVLGVRVARGLLKESLEDGRLTT